jgi:hypothetical protein
MSTSSKRKRNDENDLDSETIYQRYIIPYISQNFSEIYEVNKVKISDEKSYDDQLELLEELVNK